MCRVTEFVCFFLGAFLFLVSPAIPQSSQQTPAEGKQKSRAAQASAAKAADPEQELHHALESAGTDRAALVRNLEDYLKRFPNSPRKAAVYRALVEASIRLQDTARATEYAERFIALSPDDVSMMLLAIDLLEQTRDDQSLARAIGYASRVLDRIRTSPDGGNSPPVPPENWDLARKRLAISVLNTRGRLLMERRDYAHASDDLEASYRLLPDSEAAERLGEIAELQHNLERAIEQYARAFALAGPPGEGERRTRIRRELGNVWILAHGSEAGLGDYVLQTADRLSADPARHTRSTFNENAKEPYDFLLRRVKGNDRVRLRDWQGRTIVLSFWTTWCGPCRLVEPVFERAAAQFRSNPDILFLAVNCDEEEALVAPYLQEHKIQTKVVFSDGLEEALHVDDFPTLVILDRTGKISFRAEGYVAEDYEKILTEEIERALATSETPH